MGTYDLAIVGAGLVGLATARELLSRHPDLRVAVVEKEERVAAHQSGHNSGVLHSGVYYTPGSLKARLCVDGKRRVEEFADRHGIPFERCGKLIVAVSEDELGRLDVLAERARANGVVDARLVGPSELREIEPHAAGIRALHVPGTGIIDFALVAQAYAHEVQAAGADVLLGRRVSDVLTRGDRQVLRTQGGDIETRFVITCAGLHADTLSPAEAPPSDERIIPFRGSYYSMTPGSRHLVRGLIYPVPDPSLPFLGVHFTKRIDGEVWAGPNAVLALAREGYRRRSVAPGDALTTFRFPGFWRLARRYWRTGALELWRDSVKRAYVRELQRYVPAVRSADLLPGPSGVRAQAVRSNGAMIDDFSLAETPRFIQVRNAPSPAATASLAIGHYLADVAVRNFGWAA
jgi:(S)-2-hydroxyglutarate dehydrogenase